MKPLTAMRLALLLLLLLATPAAAEPEVVVDAHVRWQGQIVAAPEGLGPGATVSVGKRDGWGGELSWAYARFTETVEFEDDRFDVRVHYMLAGFVRRWSIDPFSFVSIGFGPAFSRERIVHLPCNGVLCSPHMSPSSDYHAGAWFDARIGMDVIKLDDHNAITIGAALQLVAVEPGAVAASGGIGYHWQ